MDLTCLQPVRARGQDADAQSHLLIGGLEGSAELETAVELYLLDVGILVDLA